MADSANGAVARVGPEGLAVGVVGALCTAAQDQLVAVVAGRTSAAGAEVSVRVANGSRLAACAGCALPPVVAGERWGQAPLAHSAAIAHVGLSFRAVGWRRALHQGMWGVISRGRAIAGAACRDTSGLRRASLHKNAVSCTADSQYQLLPQHAGSAVHQLADARPAQNAPVPCKLQSASPRQAELAAAEQGT